jgi:hypothetical protein
MLSTRTIVEGYHRRAKIFAESNNYAMAQKLSEDGAEIAHQEDLFAAEVIADFEVIIPRGQVREAYELARVIARTLADVGFPQSEPTLERSEYESEWRVFAWKEYASLSAADYARFRSRILDRGYDDDYHGEPTMGMLTENGHLPACAYRFDDGWGSYSFDAYRYLITSAYVCEYLPS